MYVMKIKRRFRGRVIMTNKYMVLPALCLLALLFRCAVAPLAGGSDNPDFIVIGSVLDTSGQPAQDAVVTIVPASYNPITDSSPAAAMIDTTSASGEYRLAVKQKGAYCVQAIQLKRRTRLLVTGISVADTATYVAAATLASTGAVKVDLPSTGINGVTGYIYVPGTTICAFLNNRVDTAVLDSVPAGTLPVLSYAATNSTNSIALRYDVTVASGDTIVVTHPSWKYCRRIFLNTTASGANIAGNVVNFPLLVRLKGDNFDFSQTQAGGADIRFANADTSFLHYEIERWDSANQRAEIWVRADTVYGDNDTQAITMYWGNTAAGDSSNGATVFDTAAQFEGVWHLAEPANGIVRDATANRYDGTPSDIAPVPAPGAIGIAREFNGVSNGIRMKGTAGGALNFNENGRYTVSAWVYSDTLDEKWHLIVGKGNGQYYLKQQMNSRNGNWEFVEYHDKVGWQITETPVTLKTWKYVTGVRDGEKQYLYIDDQLVNSTIKPNYDTTSRNTSEDITIGRYQTSVKYENEGYCFFDGKIDEVRISNVAHSADWIKLCFMNQKEKNKLVVFK
jgi:hypothetical protein